MHETDLNSLIVNVDFGNFLELKGKLISFDSILSNEYTLQFELNLGGQMRMRF